MIEKIGVIRSAKCGFGGYQDVQVCFTFELGGNGWGTIHSKTGGWGHVSEDELNKPGSNYKWTHEERIKGMGKAWWEVTQLMQKAKVDSLDKLVGKPVKVFFESEFGPNQGFDILEDAIL